MNTSDREQSIIRRTMPLLLESVKKVEHYSNDADDEFTICEDRVVRGIFKTWAFPIILVIEAFDLDHLQDLTDALNNSWLEKVEADWHQSIAEKPGLYGQTLERWRAFSARWDRRLYVLFRDTELPSGVVDQCSVLLQRLYVSFALSAAFYDLEAMIVDPRDTLLAKKQSQDSQSDNSGGALDLISMLLPAAFEDHLVADRLNWHGLDWSGIIQSIPALSAEELAIAVRVASHAEVPIKDVLFAANVLEWIPADVGGKRGDISKDQAQQMILDLLPTTATETHASVARKMNAKIRFLNWMPLVREQNNFSEVKGWRYAAVCDTAAELFSLLKANASELLKPEYADIFLNDIAPQLEKLDATSARGRYILEIFNRGLFSDAVRKSTKADYSQFIENTVDTLESMEQDEELLEVSDPQPRALVGGKVFGIREAKRLLGPEKVNDGIVLTSEAVENLLKNAGIWKEVAKMNELSDFTEIQKIGDRVSKMVKVMPIPNRTTDKIRAHFQDANLVIRSSSADEDTHQSVAAGIYESEIGVSCEYVPDAIRSVLASFFSEKAIAYRNMQGLSHKPLFAILIQEELTGEGGVIFTEGNSEDFVLNHATSAQAVVDASEEGITARSFSDLEEINSNLRELVTDALHLESLYGARVDIEYIMDSGSPKIVQMRFIPDVSNKKSTSMEYEEVERVEIKSIFELDSLNTDGLQAIDLVIGSNIDIDVFQGKLFRWFVEQNTAIRSLYLPKPVPETCHLMNICNQLGITVYS